MSVKTVILFLFTILSSLGMRIFSFACAFYILCYTDNPTAFTLYLVAIVTSSVMVPLWLERDTENDFNKKIGMILHLLNIILLFVFTVMFDTYFNYIIILGVILHVTHQVMAHLMTKNVQHMVPAEILERFISWCETYHVSLNILAPVISGLFIGYINIEHFALFHLMTEVCALFCLLALPFEDVAQFSNERTRQGFRPRLSLLLDKKEVSRLLFTAFIVNFLISAFSIAMPIIAIQVIHLHAYQFGIVEAGYMVGWAMMMRIFPHYIAHRALKKSYQISILLQALTLLLLGMILMLVHNLIVAVLLLLILNTLVGLSRPLSQQLVRAYVGKTVRNNHHKAGILTLSDTISQMSIPISLLCFGLLLNLHQAIVCLSASFLIFVMWIYFTRFFKRDFQVE
ncbi:MFS transporter [Staphylococcus lutrae]|uniref:MFS transporter n=1 Tax=Staphylococcus lutrae TaxID=155085 RepID=A0AAC9RU30_9STAP|nr:MFS transporter [Staphylococcus lutrae]ARJ50817.1 hypothetical protein B5P37_05530 [Staphylococcus lutrae]PNZ39777.1 MFS transporter [Staphylococcus lutrae]